MEDSKTPPKWRRPSEVMKQRMRKQRLDKQPRKRSRFDANTVDDTTTDGTYFRLLNFSHTHEESQPDSQNHNNSFRNALNLLNSPQASTTDIESDFKDILKELPVDWTLREKVRLMSIQPFPWNEKLKTCEEASGITGFVRCIDTDADKWKMNLDTSPNARFHQCCLIWQHPSIPWLDLYPRLGRKKTAPSNVLMLPVKDRLYQAWLDSFRSLFQLVKAKQCPYFYLITNTSVCLFRAAGVNGYSDMNVLVTPTNRGFRQLLKDENIEFTMPLKSGDQTSKSPVTNDSTDTGYESVGATDLNDDSNDEDNAENIDDAVEPEDWLENIGLAKTDIKQYNTAQVDYKHGKEGLIDDSSESLIFVEGVGETHSFFNFLINCKSIISKTGPLAGVPPTLLSPVAFTGASLTSLKVKESVIAQNGQTYKSMEIRGPVLPHMVHNLCDLMINASIDKFSLTFANVRVSQPLTTATDHHLSKQTKPSPVKTPRTSSIFGEQNLSDCGLKPKILGKFCKNDVLKYDSIKYSDSVYTCS